jgi:phage gpG-like protein
MSVEIKIRFNKDILKKLEKATNLKTKDLLKLAGLELETIMKDNAPVDLGRLRSSIHADFDGKPFKYSAKDRNNKVIQYDGTFKTDKGDINRYKILVGTNVEYAIFTEYKSSRKGWVRKSKDEIKAKINKLVNQVKK